MLGIAAGGLRADPDGNRLPSFTIEGGDVAEKSAQQQVNELKALVIGYAKQETLEPIKGVGRYLGFGLAGGLCLAAGVVMLAMAALRFFQTSLPELLDGAGHSSWVPYLLVIVLLLVGAVLTWIRATRKDSK